MTQNVDRETVVSRLLGTDDILILCHKNPDGDTIGSSAALCKALQHLGKTAAVLCSDPIPAMYDYMQITVYDGSFTPAFVVAVDVAGIQLFGDHNNIQDYAEHVDLCIDHHGSNSGYAYETLVDDHAAAAAELLTELIPQMGVELTPEIAACLYTGVATDTGCFRFTNTTANTHLAAAKLIEAGADVEKLTSAPIIGDIPLAEEGNGKAGGIAVRENENSLMAETFRGIRTNLQFMLGEENKVILVTSTISGEGKTFVATNLAISLSLLGKRVVIVGLDIRKPGLNKVFNLSQKEKGITQFLAGPQTTDLMSMVQPSGISRTLSILPGGTVPPNPTELLARQALVEAIDILKKHFDYIVLDTAPIGMVTDTQIIARVADLSVYVCRADYTHKADYTLLEDLRLGNKLPNLCTVINGLDMKKRKYGYYYGYGKYGRYYGYGKKYGYGYGYGQKHN